jgi:MarR family transcriptional regulator, 2-MHQ and catechol-resistance regulon repressor
MHESDLEALAEEMWTITKDLFKVLQFRDRDAMIACGVSVAQCYTVDAIGTQGQLTLNELAEAMYITPSTASRTVDELVHKELVARRQDPADRRAVRLSLTPQGEALYQALRRHLIQRQRAILEQIDPASRRSALTVLQKLAQAIKDPTCCAMPFEWQIPSVAHDAATSVTASSRSKPPSQRARPPLPARRQKG